MRWTVKHCCSCHEMCHSAAHKSFFSMWNLETFIFRLLCLCIIICLYVSLLVHSTDESLSPSDTTTVNFRWFQLVDIWVFTLVLLHHPKQTQQEEVSKQKVCVCVCVCVCVRRGAGLTHKRVQAMMECKRGCRGTSPLGTHHTHPVTGKRRERVWMFFGGWFRLKQLLLC